MKKPELLSPVGNFECLKSAIQNGADSVYFGASNFNARIRANNFSEEDLVKAIQYAKLRNVKVNFALNTLIKDEEFNNAIMLAIKAYNAGTDAIIIQDLGLASYLLKHYPEISLHASTQMTANNLSSIQQLNKLGFSRVVLARELDINQIKNIRENTKVQLEVFIHGALCISYSGQCLFSSMIGGRSGNRGLCAQPCRLPYELIDSNENKIDSGYLLSSRDLCGINFLPDLIKCGIDCFKIEGRLKSPEYVGVVTRIYRKYIDYIYDNISLPNTELNKNINQMLNLKNNNTLLSDKEELLQVFNRGEFSTGHLNSKENLNLIFKKKSNNQGIYLGKVLSFNQNKSYITLKLENSLSIGDKIKIENNIYNISELMIENENYKTLPAKTKVTIGRIKGDIKKNSKIYKIENNQLNEVISSTFPKELKKIPIFAEIIAKKSRPISLKIWSDCGFYNGLETKITSNILPETAKNLPISKEKIIKQISKTGNTEFEFKNIKIDLDENIFIPKISCLNELRRTAIANLEKMLIKSISHDVKPILLKPTSSFTNSTKTSFRISLLLNELKTNNSKINEKILKLKNIDNLYIPYKYFVNPKYKFFLTNLCKTFKTYVYLPNIMDVTSNQIQNIKQIILNFEIFGAVISHISQIEFFKDHKLDLIGNYTLNVFNTYSALELKNAGLSRYSISLELNTPEIQALTSKTDFDTELIVYGKTPLMTNQYCYLGNSNKCYNTCKKMCLNNEKYYLKDRMNYKFRIIPDNTTTVTTIYNSKITSISPKNFNLNYARIDILDEYISDIQNIIDTVKNGNRFEGKEYTNSKK